MLVSRFLCVILLWLIIAAAKVGECTYIVNKLPVNILKMTRNKNLKAHRSLGCRRSVQTINLQMPLHALHRRTLSAVARLRPLLLCAALGAMGCRLRKLWASASFVLVLSAGTHSAWNRCLIGTIFQALRPGLGRTNGFQTELEPDYVPFGIQNLKPKFTRRPSTPNAGILKLKFRKLKENLTCNFIKRDWMNTMGFFF